MAKFKKSYCRICFQDITDTNFRVMDEVILKVLDVLLLKIGVKEESKDLICNSCSTKLFAAFQFKITCMDTQDTIFPYVNIEGITVIDLRDIYLKRKGKKYLGSLLEGERICRLCMHIMKCKFTFIKDVETDLIRRYIPEINFSVTKEPVICASCFDLLHTHGGFLKHCWDVDENSKQIYDDVDNIVYIKTEEIEIKSDRTDEDIHNGFLNDYLIVDADSKTCDEDNAICIRTEETKVEFETSNDSQSDVLQDSFDMNETSKTKYGEDGSAFCIKTEEIEIKYEIIDDDSENSLPEDELTNHKNNLECHQLIHMSKENVCDRDSEFEPNHQLTQHQLKDKLISQEQMYKCSRCSFQTVHVSNFGRHQLVHKNISEVQMYKCDKCSLETKHKSVLVSHQLVHKDISEAEMYKCVKCNYQTKYKKGLRSHQLNHKGSCQAQIYKCVICNFETIHKYSLVTHQLKHKDTSEVKMYKCYTCNFRTKHKRSLIRHQLLHKDISETQMYKCDKCSYQSKRKTNLVWHQSRH